MKPSVKRCLTAGSLTAVCTPAALSRPDFPYAGPPVPIADGSGAAGCGQVAIAQVAVPPSANFTIRYMPAIGLRITQPRQGDVVMSLRHMDTGTTALLVDRPGYPASPIGFTASNFGMLPLTESPFTVLGYATRPPYEGPLPNFPNGIANVTSTWRTLTPMEAFLGESSAGTWQLLVSDCAAGETGPIVAFTLILQDETTCYVNCDGSTDSPFLNVNDFLCFTNLFAAGDSRANCDASSIPPVLNVNDFVCFQGRFGNGCSLP